jgi:hypothetical protein
MPPGTGKTHNHDPDSRVYDACTIVNQSSTPALVRLKEEATVTGDWYAFDREWTWEIQKKVPLSPAVVLVPCDITGQTAGWIALPALVLDHQTWVANLAKRREAPDQFQQLWELARQERAYTDLTDAQVQAVLYRVARRIDRLVELQHSRLVREELC